MMAAMSMRQAALSAAALAVLFASVAAHSNLADPKPSRRLVCRAGNDNPRDCYGPCPPMDTFGNPTGINEGNPATTWSRGSKQFVAYQRNNHGGDKQKHGPTGFVRMTLVPVDQMMSKEAHDGNAFHISCWGEGEHDCPSRDSLTCGNDETGRRFGMEVTVPTNYPDGVYALGYSWYGGGDYKEESFFGDYYGCSFVRIQGGPKTEGSTTLTNGGNECWSATDRPGVCSEEPCLGKGVSYTRPYVPSGGYVAPSVFNMEADSGEQHSYSGDQNTNAANQHSDSDNHDSSSDVISRIAMVNIATSETKDLYPNSLGYFKEVDFPRGFSVLAEVPGGASNVVFEWEGKSKREGTAPYLIAGNIGAKYGRWQDYPRGYDFTLTVNAYVSGNKHSKYVQLRID